MATAYSMTRERLRDKILRKLRVLGADESPSDSDASIVYEAIDLKLKELHVLGYLWWKISIVTSNLSATGGNPVVSAPADMLYPVTVVIDNVSLPIIQHRAYRGRDKSSTGAPREVHFSNGSFYFWPTPQADVTATLTYQKILDNTAAGTPVDVPDHLLNTVSTMIAATLADDFQIPEDRTVRLMQEAAGAERRFMMLNAPESDNDPVQAETF